MPRWRSLHLPCAWAEAAWSWRPAVADPALAAGARGLGSAWTTIRLFFDDEVSELLGIPKDWTQAALLPVAYCTGDDFKPAHRLPAADLTYWETWGSTRGDQM